MYSIENTRHSTWKEQLDKYFGKHGDKLKSSDSLFLGYSGENIESIKNAPLFIPTSVVTKAMRGEKGSRSAHKMSENDIYLLEEGIKILLR